MNYKSSRKQSQGSACMCVCVSVCACVCPQFKIIKSPSVFCIQQVFKNGWQALNEEEGGKSEEFRWLALIYFANTSVRRARKHVGNRRSFESLQIWQGNAVTQTERCITEQQAAALRSRRSTLIWTGRKPSALRRANKICPLKTATWIRPRQNVEASTSIKF